MDPTSQQPKGRDGMLTTLDAFIQALNNAKDTCNIPPAQITFGCASTLLVMIRDTMGNDQDYIDLGRACGDACQVLYHGLNGKQLNQLNQFILDTVAQLTTTVAEIERNVVEQGEENRLILTKDDRDMISSWKRDIIRIFHVFNTELTLDTSIVVADPHVAVADTQAAVSDIHRTVSAGQEGVPASVIFGESPPPAPRACFGRDEVVEKVIELAENLEPIALIGAGGIGKTAIALTVFHHKRTKERFGENRRFIRCDQLPTSATHFLARLSQVIDAGVENPEDLTPLRPFLSSKEMFIILDNAESLLDPQGTDAREICSLVDELCRFETISLCITSRITTVPQYCKRPEIPTLSMDAACDIFYNIYGDNERSNVIDDLLKRLDFHALSITLLATTASHHAWNHNQLAKEWDAQRAQVLQTDSNQSLAATIELSLTSPTFRELGPDARELLGVVAFFPQGIDRKNLHWLFPATPDRKKIFDKFFALSLTHWSNDFITMLAPIRDYLGPKDPRSSPLLCAARDHYLSRMSVTIDPDRPGFEEARWIESEDVNVEHLLDVSTSNEPTAGDIWESCCHFMEHIGWHKPRQTVLGPKIEALPDDHHSKPGCLYQLSQLLGRVGNYEEQRRLLTQTLMLERQGGDDLRIVRTLRHLSNVNRLLGFHEEGIRQSKEALEIYERMGDTLGQTQCLNGLAWVLFDDGQLDAAENATSRAINLIQEEGQEYLLCNLLRILGNICRSKGDKKKAIRHLEVALGIASLPVWHDQLLWIHCSLAELFCDEDEFDYANAHLGLAKPHVADDAYKLARVTKLQANVWYLQSRSEDATSEALRALEIYENIGAAKDAEVCRELLQIIEEDL